VQDTSLERRMLSDIAALPVEGAPVPRRSHQRARQKRAALPIRVGTVDTNLSPRQVRPPGIVRIHVVSSVSE
jgi:hypothetical protein